MNEVFIDVSTTKTGVLTSWQSSNV